jgi:hypothetical protein
MPPRSGTIVRDTISSGTPSKRASAIPPGDLVIMFASVWEYLGIRDGRQDKDLEPKFGKFYPGSASFASVRGNRPFNGRSSLRPLSRRKLERLQQSGAVMETSW